MTYKQALAAASGDSLYEEPEQYKLMVFIREEYDALGGRWYEVLKGADHEVWVSVYARPDSSRLLFYLDTNHPQLYPLPEEYKAADGWQVLTREEFVQFNKRHS